MIPVCGSVTVLATARGGRGGRGFEVRYGGAGGCGRDVMRSPEKLGRFEEHLDDMFIAMVAGGNPRVVGKEEDVHPAVVRDCRGHGSQFFTRGR